MGNGVAEAIANARGMKSLLGEAWQTGAFAPIKKRGLMNVLGKSHQVGASVGEAWGASMGIAMDYLAPVSSSHILVKLHACKINVFGSKLPGLMSLRTTPRIKNLGCESKAGRALAKKLE